MDRQYSRQGRLELSPYINAIKGVSIELQKVEGKQLEI